MATLFPPQPSVGVRRKQTRQQNILSIRIKKKTFNSLKCNANSKLVTTKLGETDLRR
jgi:transcription elongation factor Elf1